MLKLCLEVIKPRTQYQVTYDDGVFCELQQQIAIRFQGNAIEHIPISMLLLLIMEMNGHLLGLFILWINFYYHQNSSLLDLKYREYTWCYFNQITIFSSMILMILVNIYYLPWIQIFHLIFNTMLISLT